MLRPAPARRPLVTALVAAWQAERWVGRAIGSLARQTMEDLEVLVVDDASTDGTSAVVRAAAGQDPRVRLLPLQRNRGQAAALNAGLAEARGRWLALLDADDEAAPDRLARQLRLLERPGGPLAVGGAVLPWCGEYELPGPVWRYAQHDDAIRARSLFRSECITGALTLDLEAMRRGGVRFDETLRLGVDWALSLRMQELGPVANLPEVVLRYRFHAGQMTERILDDLGSDSTRIRRGALAALGLEPSPDELETHLAVSPCAYWPFGAHPFFARRRTTLRQDVRRWFGRLRGAAARGDPVLAAALGAYLEEIEALLEVALGAPARPPGLPLPCPAAGARGCLAERPCREVGRDG